jgi:hypothetical protein
VHCKTAAAQEMPALLTARRLPQSKLYDVEMSRRGVLRGFGLKVGPTTVARFEARIRELVARQRWRRSRQRFWRFMRCRRASRPGSRRGCAGWPAPTAACVC